MTYFLLLIAHRTAARITKYVKVKKVYSSSRYTSSRVEKNAAKKENVVDDTYLAATNEKMRKEWKLSDCRTLEKTVHVIKKFKKNINAIFWKLL